MKYLFKQNNYYYFRRKIPNTDINFTFSLNTKNVKLGKILGSIFLKKSEPLFTVLKYEEKTTIMSNFVEIKKLLLDYKDKAREEYSEFEEERHKHFTCTTKKGKNRDTSHPKCAKKWLDKILDIISDKSINNHQELEHFKEIFKRTKIDKSLYDSLTDKEKRIIQYKTLKTESEILVNDYKLSQYRFNPETLLQQPQYMIEQQPRIEPQKPSKFYEKTLQNMIDEFVKIKANDTEELHRYTDPLNTFKQVIDKEFLIDITSNDIQDFIFVMKNLPTQTTKENKKLYLDYKDDLRGLANYIYSNKLKTVSLLTAMEKIKKVKSFLDYCLTEERIDRNRLDNKYLLPSKKETKSRQKKEKKEPLPFTNDELNLLFNETKWYHTHIDKILEKEEFDKIYIPLISLLQGSRLKETSQLYINDIIEVENIWCFRFDEENENQDIKNNSSHRVVPIHPKLIELHFLDYVNFLKSKNEERVFPQLYHTKGKGYGQAFSKKFNNSNFKSSFISLEKLKDPKIKIDFHSFRHTFSHRAKGRIKDRLIDDILGHTGNSENQRGGAYDHSVIPLLFQEIQLLDIVGIELENIQGHLDRYFTDLN